MCQKPQNNIVALSSKDAEDFAACELIRLRQRIFPNPQYTIKTSGVFWFSIPTKKIYRTITHVDIYVWNDSLKRGWFIQGLAKKSPKDVRNDRIGISVALSDALHRAKEYLD